MLREFGATFPFIIYNRLTPEIEEGLLDGKYDIGFCSELLKSEELEYYPLRESYIAAAGPEGQDHECAGARKLGLEQILAHLRAEKAFADVPVILSGDFNAEPDSEEMKPLRETAGLVNATEGIGITFHNYHRDDPNDPQCSIDYIILKGDWELKKVEKWTEQKDGVCLSDHYPICAELI